MDDPRLPHPSRGQTPGTERTLFKLCAEGEWGWK